MNLTSQLANKIYQVNDLIPVLDQIKNQGKKIVFTNGCFDILHPGHVDYLAKTKAFGDFCVLGLNSDDSVRRQGKGADRPINSEMARAIVLAGLEAVDAIVIFDEDTPYELMQKLQPQVITKGGDYDADETDTTKKTYVVGRDIVQANGGKVEIIAFLEGFSTTKMIEKIKK